MPSKHAQLSPSGAALDLICPGNRREQAKVKGSGRSKDSALGTGAHKLGGDCLEKNTNPNQYENCWVGESAGGEDFLLQHNHAESDFLPGTMAFRVDKEMIRNVTTYTDTVRGILAGLPGAKLLVEQKSTLYHARWGTSDTSILLPGSMAHIVDYKNGTMYVDEKWNPQLMIYALGFIGHGNPQNYKQVAMTIVQPRAIGHRAVRTWGPMPVNVLEQWRDNVLFPADAKCLHPNAELIPGPHCKDKWCDARKPSGDYPGCPAVMAYRNEVVQGMFSPVPADRPKVLPPAAMMTPEQRRHIMDNRDLVTSWLKDIAEYEREQHLRGCGNWGKMVVGQNSRSIPNKSIAIAALQGILGDDMYTERTLKSAAQLENALQDRGYKKAQAIKIIEPLVKKSEGAPRLVSLDTKGKPLNQVTNMFETKSII